MLSCQPTFISLCFNTLGIDPRVELLAVCPECRGIYPSSGSRHMQEECSACCTTLFLPHQTRQGNHHTIRTSVIKYPYLPLLHQIVTILKSLGVEALLDNWHSKPHNSGEYSDIFDSRMCCLKLRALDSSLFFTNCPHERRGPNNKLRISINLGVDWYILGLTSADLDNLALGFLTFAATSYHPIHCVPLHFQSVTFLLNLGESCYVAVYTKHSIFQVPYVKSHMHEYSPGPKEQMPNKIQGFLHPIVLDLL